MKKIATVLPVGHDFHISPEPFLIGMNDLLHIKNIGKAAYEFMTAMQVIMYICRHELRLKPDLKSFHKTVVNGFQKDYKDVFALFPNKAPRFMRIDLMHNAQGEWKIAEIDPTNKHGLGFALLCRNESGHGESQKILTMLAKTVGEGKNLCLILGLKEEFFRQEQQYFATQLQKVLGTNVTLVQEGSYRWETELRSRINDDSYIFFDLPIIQDAVLSKELLALYKSKPRRFMNPPEHWMGNKALLAFVHEPEMRQILKAFLKESVIEELRNYISPTYLHKQEGRYVAKKYYSSGAKGVYFNQRDVNTATNVVYQQFVEQQWHMINGSNQYIRLAAHFIGSELGELTVTALPELPVHGNSRAVNMHVGLKT